MAPQLLLTNRPFDRETVIKEVTRGYELTTQLQSQLLQQPQPPLGDRGSELVRVLVKDVLQALAASLSILNSAADKDDGSPELGSGCSIGQGIERSGDKVMPSDARHRNKRHRGRKSHLQPWTQITSAPHYDGHQWRKYGEKIILDSKYPRCYYRCTHKDGRSCPATKQVQQKDSKDPPMFLVTYIHNHTCHNTTTTTTTTTTSTPQLSVDPTSPTTHQPFSLTFRSNTKPTLSGQMDSCQATTWPSSYDPVPPDQPTHGMMEVDIEPLSFVSGGGGVSSSPCPSPCSQGLDIMDYLLMDTSGFELNDVDSFLN